MLRNRYFHDQIVMKGLCSLLMVVILSDVCAQTHLDEWMQISGATAEERMQANQQVDELVAELKSEGISDVKLIKKMFRKVHGTMLKHYEAYADFNTLFQRGTYDCLTATALFSVLLSSLEYDFEIIETNYHIFLLVQTNRGKILIESTDPVAGLVTDPKEIDWKIEKYRHDQPVAENGYRYHCDVYQNVPQDKLTGLLVFNQAVKAYNLGKFLTCASALEKAYAAYSSDRCLELGDVLVRTLVEHKEMTAEIRSACLMHLKVLLMHRSIAVAAN